ncbi:hypothetical protein EG68_04205 [Paragonimus skrjabini miyazakii]|uniref:LicD/FKTN/FKRP nucleotidyltransferase domain-containing protein n=1 Tax=Paragonimus skrjabini miyazakii TaxID=59628 RepID=A0A8S9YUE2_9TREM|nr:hypothetical protein EG68_04205 [Paragonimus skrjabini miyazakii]
MKCWHTTELFSSCILSDHHLQFKMLSRSFTKSNHWELQLSLHITFVILLCGMLLFRVCPIGTWFAPAEVYFRPVISLEDQINFIQLLRVFQNAVESENLTYFLIGGSVIGAVRHHGMIPWDDDVDLAVEWDSRKRLDIVLSRLAPEYELHKDDYGNPTVWKLCFSNKSRTFPFNSFRWPYLDIFFYKEETDHIVLVNDDTLISKSQLFPLKRVPFGPTLKEFVSSPADLNQYLWLPAPCYIPFEHFSNVCVSNSYSHKNEIHIFSGFQRTILCERLRRDYVFVRRVRPHQPTITKPHVEITTEELQVGPRLIYRMMLEQPICNGLPYHSSEPFAIRSVTTQRRQTVPEFNVTGFVMLQSK